MEAGEQEITSSGLLATTCSPLVKFDHLTTVQHSAWFWGLLPLPTPQLLIMIIDLGGISIMIE